MTNQLDKANTGKKFQKWTTVLLAVVALALALAAGFTPRGESAAAVVQRDFDDVDVQAIVEGREGEPVSQDIVASVAAYRAMCHRTLAVLSSAAQDNGRQPHEALSQMDDKTIERLRYPAVAALESGDQNMSKVFQVLSDSIVQGDTAPALDFVTTQCDRRGSYLDERQMIAVSKLDTERGAFQALISDVISRENVDDGLPEPAEPE